MDANLAIADCLRFAGRFQREAPVLITGASSSPAPFCAQRGVVSLLVAPSL
jgi:hypothetical protein